MRFAPDPIGELRVFFAAAQPRPKPARLSPMCGCVFCVAMRHRPKSQDETRKPLSVGIFGIRERTKPNRYWELKYLRIDFNVGRGPGGHFVPTIQPMPRPNFLEAARAVRIVREVEALICKVRIPLLKVGDSADYRKELAAEAVAILAKKNPPTVKQAVDNAEKRLLKQHRELR